MNPNNRIPWRYGVLLSIAWLPVLVLSLWQAIRHKRMRFLLQRFAYTIPQQTQHTLWLHAASVGEVIAVVPLVKRLQQQFPNTSVVVSTITPTGADMVQQRLPQVLHIYLPLDTKSGVKKFLHRIRPLCALIMETELWPQLYSQCQKQNIPLLTINARLSERTLNTRSWIRELYAYTVNNITAILAKSDRDAKNYIELGADPKITHIVGNIKYAALQQVGQTERLVQRPYVLAASTHADEEQRIAKAWIDKDLPYLLVIAPRHPNRSESIVKQLTQITDRIAIRSRKETVTQQTRIYLADTLGELASFMAYAEVVFMGGSLVPVGGHNILEPANLAKPILFGPYMHNFIDECEMFLQHMAAWQVEGEQELMDKMEILLASESKRQTLSHRAQVLVQKQGRILDDYMDYILKYCPQLMEPMI